MTRSTEPSFCLQARHGADAPALTRVDAQGRLEGLLLTLTLRQSYRNAGAGPIEAVYTFPLPADAVLLGLAAEFDGRRIVGRVVSAEIGEATYEKALAKGDAPVLLERAGNGLFTANLGNLKPGETATIEVRFAQLVQFEQGRLRVAIPTTIAPRYGDPVRAGMQPHQAPESSIAVEYPLALSLTVAAPWTGAHIECPTHAHRIERTDDGTRMDLAPGAALDRDVVVLVTPDAAVPNLMMHAADKASGTAPALALATFSLPAAPSRERIVLRLLVDCSGSMGGDSIASARAALRALLDGLRPGDEVSLTRFGSDVEHVIGAACCDERHLERLREAIDAIDANMGGTEIRQALEAVFGAWPRPAAGADVLLITDGEVWQAAETAAAARRSGHRVFAIGVGSAPAESVLRRLAEGSSGAVAFATPGESLRRAAERMLARMRQPICEGLRVDWGAEPVWELPLPRNAFAGDTLLVAAGFAKAMRPDTPARLLIEGADGRATVLAATSGVTDVQGADLARMAAARRLDGVGKGKALSLALTYQLVSRQTHCVLVHERADADRSTEPAQLQRVAQMLAAGWGASSTVSSAPIACSGQLASVSTPSVWLSARPSASRVLDKLDVADDVEIPAFLLPARDSRAIALRELAGSVWRFIADGGSVADLVVHMQGQSLPVEIEAALDEAAATGIGRSQAWLLLALWVARQHSAADDARAAAALAPLADALEPATRDAALTMLETRLSEFAKPLSRAQRLERAMRF